ncbi:MAG: DnaB-like helicase C-terminal domain-containing protein [Janthinobacterium lividum]
MSNWWREPDFQQNLLSFICRDRNFLKKCGSLLQPKDFKPNRDETDERLIIATIALDFWRKHSQPVGGMLRVYISEYITQKNVDDKRKKLIAKLVDNIQNGERLVAVEAMEDRVIAYLRTKKMKDSIEKLITKQEEGELDDKTFIEICKEVLEFSGNKKRTVSSYLEKDQVENRISRREVNAKQSSKKRPMLFLEGFDTKSPGIGRGDLGVILAPYKKGKSLFLAHIADAYAKQNLNVLYITLEDPKDEVEDRMDAALAYMPINRLAELPNKFRKRFKKFAARIQGHIRIVDCTDVDTSVEDIEQIWENLRDQGWTADAIIVDYDDEIKSPRAHKGESARRHEFADIYRALRKLAARRDVFLWTAAQTRKVPDNTKIVSADMFAEDVSKGRKATIVIGLGQGETNPDSKYIHVALNKRGPMHFGFEVVANPSHGLLYDSELTHNLVKTKRK